jgi:hypothetical protein
MHEASVSSICQSIAPRYTWAWEDVVKVLADMRHLGWPIDQDTRWLDKLAPRFTRHAEGWFANEEPGGYYFSGLQAGWTKLLMIADELSPEFRVQLHAQYGRSFVDPFANRPTAVPSAGR